MSRDDETTSPALAATAQQDAAAEAGPRPKTALDRLNERFGYLVGDVIPAPEADAFGPSPTNPVPITYPDEIEHLNEPVV
jgi:hypothetical protein